MELIDHLPPIYDGNTTMQELQGILTADINGLLSSFDTTMDECFINTSTKLLSRYEDIYGLQVDITKSDVFRRERILAKIRGIGTTTKKMIKQTAAAYSGGAVEVIEHPETNSFIVKFVGTLGIPGNMADLTLTIEEIKPAHLSFSFAYTYRRWSELTAHLWGDVTGLTWYELSTE
ncbi:MAG: hypothetical protein K0R92_337 [Lachnospiraceae bacterium]|jgi:uncharacterized protein YmfQ (DUF2313 family)|nr:hypothetical protein [Lachnospiraceae bacterium]